MTGGGGVELPLGRKYVEVQTQKADSALLTSGAEARIFVGRLRHG
jgi:hypothetical protein